MMESVRGPPSDLISNLPDSLKESILMYLPTRDAVRTSILSKKWRYSWAKLPQFIIDETLWRDLPVKYPARTALATILCHLLSLHEGPIKKFTLSVPKLESCPEIDNLIYYLSRNGIEDLTLEMCQDDFYKFPLLSFTSGQLRHLSLKNCLFGTTPLLGGFSRLVTLKLLSVKVAAKVLGDLVSSCPLLQLLVLRNIIPTTSDVEVEIEIDAPNLKTFCFIGFSNRIILKNVPRLSAVLIKSLEFEGASSNLIKFFHNLPVIENVFLDVLQESIVARSIPEAQLSKANVPRRLQTTLVYLKHLRLLPLHLGCDQLLLILCLIRSSPYLKRIMIEFSTHAVHCVNDIPEFLKEPDFSDIFLYELKEVKLKGVTGTLLELELIKLLLANSPRLQKMLIRPISQDAHKTCKILKELTKFRRASKEVEVIYV